MSLVVLRRPEPFPVLQPAVLVVLLLTEDAELSALPGPLASQGLDTAIFPRRVESLAVWPVCFVSRASQRVEVHFSVGWHVNSEMCHQQSTVRSLGI